MDLDSKMTKFLEYMEEKIQNLFDRTDQMETGEVLRKYTD